MRDDAGLEELFEQTRQIVAMTRRTATPVFGTQLAFNLLPAPLPADPLAAQLGAVLGASPAAVALQVLQGGIFHSVSASLWVRCAEPPSPQAIRKAARRRTRTSKRPTSRACWDRSTPPRATRSSSAASARTRPPAASGSGR